MSGLFDLEPPSPPAPKPAPELRDRTWWRYHGEDVEIRGTSPLMVWFTRRGESQLAQRTVERAEFLRTARPLR